MEIRLLEYFVAVCEELHFTRAAEKLNISQPSLSQQIHILESNLGTKLFKRTGRKVYMTQSAEILLTHAHRIFAEIVQAKEKINQIENLEIGSITIGCIGNFSLHSFLLKFHQQYPNINISLLDTPTETIIKNVVNNQYDFGITYLPVKEPQLESELLLKTEFTLVVSDKHKLANSPFVTIEDLQAIPLILLPKHYHTRQLIDAYCQKKGITLKPLFEVSDVHSLYETALLNMEEKFATILSTLFMEGKKNSNTRIIPIIHSNQERIPKYEIGIIYRKDHKMSALSKVFLEDLIQYYRKK